jgi:two-component system, LytTR family, sensor kinase
MYFFVLNQQLCILNERNTVFLTKPFIRRRFTVKCSYTLNKTGFYKWVIHFLFWAIFCWLAYRYTVDFLKLIKIEKSNVHVLLYSILYMPFLMVPVYLNYFVLLPKYFIKRRFVIYFFLMFVSVIAASLLVCVVEDLFLRPSHPDWLYSGQHLFSRVPYLLVFNFLIHFSFLFEEVQRKQRMETELKKANAETELKWLKAQVNPHFLFNTLNNIYSLAYVQSTETAPAVMKLSELMRYMLQESNAEKIPVQKEAAYLENYIQLQALKKRYAPKIETDIELQSPSLQIAPMLLINFVENAFKHSNLEDAGAWVKMKLHTNQNTLDFRIENTFGQTGSKDAGTGIGIENVKQRLQLLYQGRHQLMIQTKDAVHSVHLIINNL